MKTLLTGSPTFNRRDILAHRLAMVQKTQPITEIVLCGCGLFDKMSAEWAEHRDIPVKLFFADWKQHKRGVGANLRNEATDYAESLVAFWDGEGQDVKWMIWLAKRRGIGIRIFKVER